MKLALAAVLAAALAVAASAAEPPKVTQIAVAQTTWSGQPIVLPQGKVEVRAMTVDIPVAGRLPPHKHPYPRYAYVQAGRLSVTNEVTGQTKMFGAGEFVVEAVDQWHSGETVGGEPVRLLVIDEAPPGAANVVPKPQ
jgi:quercetin dioxygenase-like cupin family protein